MTNTSKDGVIVKVEIFHSNTETNDYVLYAKKGGSPFTSGTLGDYLLAKHKKSGLYRYFNVKSGNFYDHDENGPFYDSNFDGSIENDIWSKVEVKAETVTKYVISVCQS